MISQMPWKNIRAFHINPPAESYRTSATETLGRATLGDKLNRSPSIKRASFIEDLPADDCNDSELPKVLWKGSLIGLYDETDEISSLELSYPSSMPSYISFALICKEKAVYSYQRKRTEVQNSTWIKMHYFEEYTTAWYTLATQKHLKTCNKWLMIKIFFTIHIIWTMIIHHYFVPQMLQMFQFHL